MFNLMKLFDSTAREVKRLNKDAPNIVEYAEQCFRPEVILGVANTTRQHLERVHSHYPGNRDGWKQAVADYERQHREARTRHDDVTLTAFTFVLIYIRAEAQGEACRSARDAIEGFIDQYADAETAAAQE